MSTREYPGFEDRLRQATREVQELDEVDGWPDRELSTILYALEAGLKRPESNCAFHAYVMLLDLVRKKGGAA